MLTERERGVDEHLLDDSKIMFPCLKSYCRKFISAIISNVDFAHGLDLLQVSFITLFGPSRSSRSNFAWLRLPE